MSAKTDPAETTVWRVRLAKLLLRDTGWVAAPLDATDAMVIRCLETSVRIMKRDGVDSVYPDEPGPRPREVARAAYRAMVEAA